MLPQEFIFLSIPFYAISYYFYIKNMFSGETRPNLASWFIWMLAPFLGVFFDLKAGAGLSALPVFLAGFGPFIILSILFFKRNYYWRLTNFDVTCGALSLIALIFYIITRDLNISVIFVILSDGLAALPTIVKSWKFPETETSTVYFFGVLSQILGLLTIKNWILLKN